MKLKLTVLAIAPLLIASHAAAADPTGVWMSPSRGAHIQIMTCGDNSLCGKLLSASKPRTNPEFLDVHNRDPLLRSRHMMGQIVMEGFTGGPVKWTGGHVYNPGDGNTYGGVITVVDDNHLKLTGCAFWFLCKSQTWVRVEE